MDVFPAPLTAECHEIAVYTNMIRRSACIIEQGISAAPVTSVCIVWSQIFSQYLKQLFTATQL